MRRTSLSILIFLCLGSFVFSQDTPPKKYSKAELRALDSKYEEFQKQINAIQKERQKLENALKAYDANLKSLAETLQKSEEQIDFASGIYSYDANFSASTQQVRAMEMTYNLKSVELINEIQREQTAFTQVTTAMARKYEDMQKVKSVGH